MAKIGGTTPSIAGYLSHGARVPRAGWLLSAVALFCQTAPAQPESIQAEFAGAGARAMAMGGAFIGLADDATATDYNPAGLWQLRRPELALQVAHTWERRSTPAAASTGAAGRTVRLDVDNDYFTPSYASFVWPFQRVTLAVSQLTSIRFRRAFRDPVVFRGREVANSRTAWNNVLALSAATEVTRGLSIGGSLRYGHFQYELESANPTQEGKISDWAPSAVLGVLWRHDKWAVGAVYKTPQAVKGTFGERKVNMHLPYTVGVGVAFKPTDNLRLLADVDHIGWSSFDPIKSDDWKRKDVTRLHLGGEWYLGSWGDTAIDARAGYMFEQSNAFRYRGPRERLDKYTAPYRSARDIHHGTFGLGFSRDRFQFDMATDIATNRDVDLILSTVIYF